MRSSRPSMPFLVAVLALRCVPALAQSTTVVSVTPSGATGNYTSLKPGISGDGRWVSFSSSASDILPGDTNGQDDVFVYDLDTGRVELVSVSQSGGSATGQTSFWIGAAGLSTNGRFVAFTSAAYDLVPQDAPLGQYAGSDVFVRDRVAGTTTRVNEDSAGRVLARYCVHGSIDASGRVVAYGGQSTGVLPGVPTQVDQVFVHDAVTGLTTVASASSTGVPANFGSGPAEVSGDGRYVTFHSRATNLVSGDVNGVFDVFVHDRLTAATRCASVSSSGAIGDAISQGADVSADGRWIVFWSDATNLIDGERYVGRAIYVHDAQTGTTQRLRRIGNTYSNGDITGGGLTPSISASGRFVAFSDSNNVQLLDRETDTTQILSVNAAGEPGNGSSHSAVVSDDGGRVAFQSHATNLVEGDRNGSVDCFVRQWTSVRVNDVFPAMGSELGDDLVHVVGSRFPSNPLVRFDGADAVVVAASSERLDVRTPPGHGVVEVSVSDAARSGGSRVSAFTYVAPELAVRYGTVNVGRGERENVLLVNASVGDPVAREVSAPARSRVDAVIVSPTSRRTSRFVVYAWGRAPGPGTVTRLPLRLGRLGLAPPFAGGVPVAVWNNAGHRRVLGVPTIRSRPAPSSLFRSTGSPAPLVVTFQGLIEDDGSASASGWSVTNAIVLRIL